MLHDENASYGFRRNLLGLKAIAVTITLISIGVALIAWWIATVTGITWSAILTTGKTHPKFPVVLVLDLIYLSTLLMLVRSEFVLQASREYAEALFRTLDMPSKS